MWTAALFDIMSKILRLHGFALALWLLAATATELAQAAAAHGSMRFVRLGTEQGLAQSTVHAIGQDSAGYMWLGTEDGLYRYDGYELRPFRNDRADAQSLPNNWVTALVADTGGAMWVSTAGSGLVRFDPRNDHFARPAAAADAPLIGADGNARAMHTDQAGRLWVGTRDAGLQMIGRTGRPLTYSHSTTDRNTLASNSIFAIDDDADGVMWIATSHGVDRLDPRSGEVWRYGERLRRLVNGASPVPVRDVLVHSSGAIWLATDSGVVRLDTAADKLQLFRHRDTDAHSLPTDRATALLEDQQRRIWVGTENGLALYDSQAQDFLSFPRNVADPTSLPDSFVTTLFEDRSGLIWVGTRTSGVARWNPRSWSFGHRLLPATSTNNVAAFAVTSAGDRWVGTVGGGLVRLGSPTTAPRVYRKAGLGVPRLPDDNVMALAVEPEGTLWVGTMSAGVMRLDPRTGAMAHYRHNPADPTTLPENGIMALLLDSRQRLWVGTYGGGLAHINVRTGAVTRYPTAGDNSLGSDRATSLAEDQQGLIWVGTDGAGLAVLDPSTMRFMRFAHDQSNPRSVSAATIYSMHVTSDGVVWVGTRGGGLDRVVGRPFSADTVQFSNISERDGLPNNTVYGIESDATGALWVSTNSGLGRFDPRNHRFKTFRRAGGLQSDEFNFGAHFRDPTTGELLFGGAWGYNVFDPQRIETNQTPPPLLLTSIQHMGDVVSPDDPSRNNKQLHLGYRDHAVSFQFAALDYTSPADNRYAYKLEGFDSDWVQAGATRQATYKNLAGGNYMFRVRGANSDGVWNETGAAFPVRVDVPPWLSWWALVGYFGALAAALFGVWALQQRRVQRQAEHARHLTQLVQERTTELAQRNDELARTNHKLAQSALADPLTGLANRRALHERLDALFAAALPDRPQYVMMTIDLDNLKVINDQHGHSAGDRAIVSVAQVLLDVCEPAHTACRWGGDEFVVLMPATSFDAAAVLAERIRTAVTQIQFRGDPRLHISCSIGFAPAPFVAGVPDGASWEQTLSLADAALYMAKSTRNDWVGWVGSKLAANLPGGVEEILANAQQLETQGALNVVRRQSSTAESMTSMRSPATWKS
jgi:diguanylate cyclase (GGDEF)-like protein